MTTYTIPKWLTAPGTRIEKLMIIEHAASRGGLRYVRCRCDCGKECEIAWTRLKRNRVKSCGCLVSSKGGISHSAEYKIWKKILSRCLNPKDKSYAFYGGRGISVYCKWRISFGAFLAHVGMRPSPKHEIDRIDNERGYEPDNLRWATRTEQMRNTRGSHRLTYDGVTKSLADWAEEYGINRSTLYARVVCRGWPLDRALNEPRRPGLALKYRSAHE